VNLKNLNRVIKKKLEETYAEMLDVTEVVKNQDEPYFRPSNAPSCCVKLYLDICEGRSQGFFEEKDHFFKDWYTGNGTASHLILQKWMGKSGKLLGDWKCSCGAVRKHTTKNVCRKCGKDMVYEELEILHNGIKGHCDGILEYKIDKKKYHVVIDFKGTTAERIRRHKPSAPLYPYEKNVKQIGIYTHVFNTYEDLNVVGWALIYISRDDPKVRLICWKMFEPSDWKQVKIFFDKEAHQNKVWNLTLEDHKIKRLVDNKRCADEDDYKKNVRNMFSPCPLSKVCFSAPKRLLSILEDGREELQTVNKRVKKKKNT
jgi:hypothetical protein